MKLEIELKLEPFGCDEINPESKDFKVIALHQGEKIGYVCCYHESGRLYSFEVNVSDLYRRKGVATQMYNFAEKVSGKSIYPHHSNPYNSDPDSVSVDALAFWQNRNKY